MTKRPTMWQRWWALRNGIIALLALLAIALHLMLYYGAGRHDVAEWPLWVALVLGAFRWSAS